MKALAQFALWLAAGYVWLHGVGALFDGQILAGLALTFGTSWVFSIVSKMFD